MKYTYQQLETIRERARALGIEADFYECEAADIEAYLYVPTPVSGVSISYYPGPRSRLVMAMVWGRLTDFAEEIEALHATLTADFTEPVEPGAARDCGVCSMGRIPAGCALIGCRPAETSEAAP